MFLIQGTTRPTKYFVLRDDCKFEADELQEVTYYLTFCFVRCLKSIAVPSPVAYANLCCYRARQHYLAAESQSLSEKYQKFTQADVIKYKMYFV